jgi:hypothetical protein
MPSLDVTFTGNAQPLYNEMARMKSRINQNIGRSLSEWMIGGNAPNPGSQRSVIGKVLDEATHSGFNLNGVLRETLVIFREIGRGNWARVPGSFSLILQYAGVLKYLLNPLVGSVALIGGGIYMWSRHLKNSAEEAYKFSESLTEVKGKFEQQAAAIKQESDNLRTAAKSAEEFHHWLEKLGIAHETLEQKTADEVKALHERFQLEQEIAAAHGQTEQQKLAAEQGERAKENAKYTEALAKAQSDYNKSLADSKSAEADLEDFQKSKQAGTDPMSRFQQQAKSMDDVIQKMKESHPELFQTIQVIQHAIDLAQKTGRDPFAPPSMVNAPAGPAIAQLKEQLTGLYQKYVSFSGGTTSLETLQSAFADEKVRTQRREKIENDLVDTEEKLKNALKEAQERHEKNNVTVNELTKRQAELKNEMAAHDEFDKQLAGVGGRHGGAGGGDLTANQRIGAFSLPGQTTMIDLQRKQVQQQTLTNTKLDAMLSRYFTIPGF